MKGLICLVIGHDVSEADHIDLARCAGACRLCEAYGVHRITYPACLRCGADLWGP